MDAPARARASSRPRFCLYSIDFRSPCEVAVLSVTVLHEEAMAVATEGVVPALVAVAEDTDGTLLSPVAF